MSVLSGLFDFGLMDQARTYGMVFSWRSFGKTVPLVIWTLSFASPESAEKHKGLKP